jgi:CheY-like chemotaxis protein
MMDQPGPPRPRRVLVIDDEPSIRTICRMILESAGYEIHEAADGQEGIAACRRESPDLVLCDISMPIKSGLEVVHELRQEFPEVKIIAMSGSAWPGDDFLAKARKYGAAATLAKPFTADQLVEALRSALASAEPEAAC